MATGIALAACQQGHRVRFYNAAGLVNELIQVQDEHQLPKFLATALRHRLIVLDELGFIPFSSTGAQLIFQFNSTLYERVSMLVTANLRFADWTQVFGDERLTAALPDWLTHKAHILDFTGESYRFRQRMEREAQDEGHDLSAVDGVGHFSIVKWVLFQLTKTPCYLLPRSCQV